MNGPTIEVVMRAAVAQLTDAGVSDAARDARRLMAAALGIAPDQLIGVLPNSIGPETTRRFEGFVAQRQKRQPVSQIVGGRWFYGRWFKVTPDVLDPRPETETLVEVALGEPFTHVLDLGTGSGAILVTLLAERPKTFGVGTDLSEAGILVAGDNAEAHGVADRLILPVSDWWEDVGGSYDLIVSNPPYIAAGEIAALAPEVRDWEPRMALTDEADGLTAYRAIAAQARDHLRPGGRLLVEIGPTQAGAVDEIFRGAGLEQITIHHDLDGRDRVAAARPC